MESQHKPISLENVLLIGDLGTARMIEHTNTDNAVDNCATAGGVFIIYMVKLRLYRI